jgi:hypothetical protein
MKVAVCYSGFMRTFPKVFDNHYNMLLKNYDCDLYFSFWDVWGNGSLWKHDYTDSDVVTDEDKKQILELYKPKEYEFESQTEFGRILDEMLKNNVREFPYCSNILSMHYKINKVVNMVDKSGVDYDIVLRIRTDHNFIKPFKFKETKKDIFYTSTWPVRCNGTGMNDQVAYSDLDTMKKYAGFFDKWDVMNKGRNCCVPEWMLKEYMDMVGLMAEDDENVDHWILSHDGTLR